MQLDEFEATLCIPSPLQQLDLPLFRQKNLQVFIKRDDLIHPVVSGNKWRKLAPNLHAMQAQGFTRLISFGGAYSNHLHACAFACQQLGIEFIAVVRGDRPSRLSPTLQDIEYWGGKLHFVSRSQYIAKASPDFLQLLQKEFGPAYIVAEGGAGEKGQQGCEAIVTELKDQMPVEKFAIALAAGTATTACGVATPLATTETWIYPVLKIGESLQQLAKRSLPEDTRWRMHWRSEYHFGGYARVSIPLIYFIQKFEAATGIALDPVYTAKLCYGFFQDVALEIFPGSYYISLLHSGGLQGSRGYILADYAAESLPIEQKSIIDAWFE